MGEDEEESPDVTGRILVEGVIGAELGTLWDGQFEEDGFWWMLIEDEK